MNDCDINEKVKCPLSGHPAIKNIEYIETGKLKCEIFYYTYNVETPFGEIIYALSKFLHNIIENETENTNLENMLQDKVAKTKIWVLIVEHHLRATHKSIFLNFFESFYLDKSKFEEMYKYKSDIIDRTYAHLQYYIINDVKDLIKKFPTHIDMVDRILGNFIYLGKSQGNLFGFVSVGKGITSGTPKCWEIFFTNKIEEIELLIDAITADGLLYENSSKGYDIPKIQITLKGIQYYNGTKDNTSSKICFIAMKFGKNLDGRDMSEFRDSVLKVAAKEAGDYDAYTVNETEFNDDILDQIISGIRSSKFIICDLSGGNNGAYFEGGFAKGLNKEVIFICEEKWFETGKYNQDDFEKSNDKEYFYDKTDTNKDSAPIHFDISHKNIIVYKEGKQGRENLKRRLINRIRRTIV